MRIGSAAIILALLASPAFAQQPTVEDVQTQYLIETGQLRQALGQAQAQIKQLRAQIAAKEAPADGAVKK